MTVKQQNWTLFENTEELRETATELRDMFYNLPCKEESLRFKWIRRELTGVWVSILTVMSAIGGLAYLVIK
jgi:hypothetical protein